MRQTWLVIGLLLVFFTTTGVNECYPPGTGGKATVHCGTDACTVVVHYNDKCKPVDESGQLMLHVRVKTKDDVCLFNDAKCPIRLIFTTRLFEQIEINI